MTLEALQMLWFIILGIFLTGYAILDGFDLGVGILHPLARTDEQRRISINAIGPIWDGNEVWLIVYGGTLLAGFPEAYATIFSGFYNAFMLVLFALILRAVSIEFRSKRPERWWRRTWDGGFFLGSFLASLVFGIAVGNGVRGVPLNERGWYIGTFLDLLNPYALLAGAMAVTMFTMHGALFLFLKTPRGEMRDRLRNWMWHAWGLFLVCYVLMTIYTLTAVPRATESLERFPWAAGVVVVNVLAIANIPRAIYAERPREAFASSCVVIAALIFLFSLAIYPNLVPASNVAAHSITIFNGSSSKLTLFIMSVIAGIGAPLVFTYNVLVYRTFAGEVQLDEHSY